MKTFRTKENIRKAAEILRAGGLVAVPTETVYGLAGNALDASAVRRIYEVKGRPEVKALSVMVPDEGAMERWCVDVPKAAHALAARFWPGPLTLVLRSAGLVPEITRAGGSTLALRCPDHPLTLSLLRETELPLAAPSANPSGAPSPKSADEVLAYFDGKIDAVLDGGRCGIGRESTIIDLSAPPYRILRQGALPEAEILDALRESLTLVGITGGTGCGKTTALNILHARGALILDCDEIYHALTVSSEAMRGELIERFGPVYEGTALNRKALGAVVFSDPAALRDLNAITHKYVSDELTRRLTEYAVNGGTLAAIDAIGLLDIEYARKTVFNVAVTAPTEDRVRRLMRREGISRDYALKRIRAQKSNAYFAQHCDYVLENTGTLAEFEEKCERFFTEVLKDV
jgi:L-threonylcarbamoyladenylate synthase